MAKKTKSKIPKRIAGVKLPKELRKTGEAILDKANSPAGREMLAAGLTMAAAAATAAVAKRGQTAAAPPETPNASPQGTEAAPDVGAMINAAGQALGRLFATRT